MKIIKSHSCKKLSKQSKLPLSYDIGHQSKQFFFRISSNEGGIFSSEWIAWKDIQKAISAGEVFNAIKLNELYKSSSSNNGGFLCAILTSESLVEQIEDSERLHMLVSDACFKKEMNALVKAKTDLPDIVAEHEKKKAAAMAKRKNQLESARKKNSTKTAKKAKA